MEGSGTDDTEEGEGGSDGPVVKAGNARMRFKGDGASIEWGRGGGGQDREEEVLSGGLWSAT